MKPDPASFTKNRPCSKIEIFDCFWGKRDFSPRQVYEVEAELGRHVPRHMMESGRLILSARGTQDVYVLTKEGKDWLRSGIVRYLNNHPSRIPEIWDRLPASVKSLIRHEGANHEL